MFLRHGLVLVGYKHVRLGRRHLRLENRYALGRRDGVGRTFSDAAKPLTEGTASLPLQKHRTVIFLMVLETSD